MKKILITRKLLKENDERVKKIFDAKFNTEDKLYNAEELISLAKGCDGILSFTTTSLNKEVIEKFFFFRILIVGFNYPI